MQFYKKILTRNNLLYLTGTVWGMVGFNRGIIRYEYEHKYDKVSYFYTDKICSGIAGLLIYINPAFLPFVVYKEIYRLEINLRGLEEKKDTQYYHNFLF